MVAVSGSAFGVTGERAAVVLLRDNIFELLRLKSTAPIFHLLML